MKQQISANVVQELLHDGEPSTAEYVEAKRAFAQAVMDHSPAGVNPQTMALVALDYYWASQVQELGTPKVEEAEAHAHAFAHFHQKTYPGLYVRRDGEPHA